MKTIIPLDPIELSFHALDSKTTSQVISVICSLDKPIPENKLREKLEQLAPSYPSLFRTLKSPNWVEDKDYKIQNNLIFQTPDEKETLFGQCSKNFMSKLDSAWKIFCITGKENGIQFVFHHSLCDGMGIIDLINAFAKDSLEAIKQKKPSKSNLSIRLKAIKHVLKDLLDKRCISPINGNNSEKRIIKYLDLSLEEVISARKVFQNSFHEYMVTITTDAIEKYFKIQNFQTDSLNILTPVSHRNPKNNRPLGNFLTGMSTKFLLNLDNQEKKIEEIKNKIRLDMEQKNDDIYIFLANKVAKIPQLFRNICCNFAATRTHLICSSLPSSSKNELKILGSRINGIYGTAALMKGHGMSLVFSRYLDKMCISMVSDPNIIKEPETILNLIKLSHSQFYEFSKEVNNA